MTLFILRRLATIPIVMVVLSLGIFGLMQFIPPERRVNVSFGEGGFAMQYWHWLKEALQGNLGESSGFSQPVLKVLLERLPASAELAIFAFVPMLVVGIWLGSVAALNRGGVVDRLISTFAVLGWSTPTFVFAIWLLVLFYGGFGVFGIGRISDNYSLEIARGAIQTPTNLMTFDALLNGRLDMFFDALEHLVLPVSTLVLIMTGRFTLLMRGSMLEVLKKDYVRTARAKGLAETVISRKHARKNALLPVVTAAGLTFSSLIAGIIIIESVFDIDGVGAWFTVAAATFDTAAVVGFALAISLFTLLVNLLVDLIYGFLDPRIRYD
jgi:dipeptide transport system permease protein